MAKRHLIGFVILAFAPLLFAVLASLPIRTAHAQTRPTATPTRKSAQTTATIPTPGVEIAPKNGFSMALGRTASGGTQAGPTRPAPCPVSTEEIPPPSLELLPSTIQIIRNLPYQSSTRFKAKLKGVIRGSDTLEVILQDPAGNDMTWNFAGGECEIPEDDSFYLINNWYIRDFDDDAPIGQYELSVIKNGELLLEDTLLVEQLDWKTDKCICPYFVVAPVGADGADEGIRQGESFDITFSGYQPNEQLIVNLIDYTDKSEPQPVSWWEVTLNAEGKGSSRLTMPGRLSAGTHALLAVPQQSVEQNWKYVGEPMGLTPGKFFYHQLTVLPSPGFWAGFLNWVQQLWK